MIGSIVSRCEKCNGVKHGFYDDTRSMFFCEDCYNSLQVGAVAENDYFWFYMHIDHYSDTVSNGGDRRFRAVFGEMRDIICADDEAYVKEEAENNPIEKVRVGDIMCTRQKLSYL